MKNKMVLKLAACFAVVLLFFTAVLGTVFLTLFQEHIVSINRVAMEEKAVSIAKTLAEFETDGRGMGRGGMGMGMGNMNGMGAYLRYLNELAMAEVWIVDENLNLLICGHGLHETTYANLPENAEQIVGRVFAGELTYGEEFSGLLGVPSLSVGAPIWADDTVVGAVLLHSPVSGVADAVREGVSALVIGAMVALLLAGLAGTWLAYRFTRPLAQMNRTALFLAEGNYEAKTEVNQQDEIGQLAQTIDQLAVQLQSTKLQREALDQLKQSFVANVSHELRTPVAVLRGSLEVLQDGTVNNPEEIEDYYQQMLLESHHLERLVNDLLDLSRLEDVGFKLEMDEVNLCDVVHDVVRAIRRSAGKKQVLITFTAPEEDCLVMGDYGRLRQLAMILLDNALKFSSVDGVITLTLEKDQAISFSVIDHGSGVSPEEIPHIFERFHKTNSPQNKNGTGLGLAIAKEIAQRHAAEITVESNQDGTTFTVCFLQTL